MSHPAIQVENLSKQYRIGGADEKHRTFREAIAGAAAAPFRRLRRLSGAEGGAETIWALKNVSFEVQPGEVVGVIGRNGAGKSTLLKILSRITEPTSGRVEIRGRVASLLEVGTGFHPELTGRENIVLNGAILGMRRREIERKFDEIVAFAEVEKFIDTSVKRYSSGMYLRLAFAVAAHLEPEILVVDEVLAVGDAAFQKKCLGKMDDVASEGRTVLLVSHNMAAILALCRRAALLDASELIAVGNTRDIVTRYLRQAEELAAVALHRRSDRQGDQSMSFTSVELLDARGRATTSACSGEDITLAIGYQAKDPSLLRGLHIGIGVRDRQNVPLFHLSTTVSGFDCGRLPATGTLFCQISQLPLQSGSYTLHLICRVAGRIADWIQDAITLHVEHGDFFGTGKLPSPSLGPFLVSHSWTVHPRAGSTASVHATA
jgi:lipopolysaccharide transport system ATP-binding protein